MAVEKSIPKKLPRPITIRASNALSQSVRKNMRRRCELLWFCFSLVEKVARTVKPMTKRSNRNRAIAFDIHLKQQTILMTEKMMSCGLDVM